MKAILTAILKITVSIAIWLTILAGMVLGMLFLTDKVYMIQDMVDFSIRTIISLITLRGASEMAADIVIEKVFGWKIQ